MLPDVSHLGRGGSGTGAGWPKPFPPATPALPGLWDHPRNLTDDMLPALGDRGCLVENFYAGFLGPHPTSRLDDLLRHIRHLLDTAGPEAVALGSDFDGIDCPLELGDAGHLDRLTAAMDRAGFSDREIEAVCWQNAWTFSGGPCLPHH